MAKLHLVYGVYAEQSDNVDRYACMLWSDLDVMKMMSSTEEMAHKLAKLKELKHLPTYDLVHANIQGFYNSLPLMKELKSEALRCAAAQLPAKLLTFYLPATNGTPYAVCCIDCTVC